MNKVAHYNGFVGRCQQYGLTKQAADMLYKQAQFLPTLLGLSSTAGLAGGGIGVALTHLLGGDDKDLTRNGGIGGGLTGGLLSGAIGTGLIRDHLQTLRRYKDLGRKLTMSKRITPILGALGLVLGGTALGAGTGAGLGKALSYIKGTKKD